VWVCVCVVWACVTHTRARAAGTPPLVVVLIRSPLTSTRAGHRRKQPFIFLFLTPFFIILTP